MKKAVKTILSVLNDQDRKPLTGIISDLLWLKRNHAGKSIKHYFHSLVYKKNAGRVEDYVDLPTILRIREYQSDESIKSTPIMEDKILFSEAMRAAGYQAAYLGKIESSSFYDVDDNVYSMETDAAEGEIRNLLAMHGSIFVKQVDEFGGKGVYKIKEGDVIDISLFRNGRRFIVERTLSQHDELNKINPYCINTVRCVTYNDGQNPEIVACFLRMGVNKAFKDNGSAGGIFVAYDIHENKLGNVAYKLFKSGSGAASYYAHPDTGFVFDKTPLPYPTEVIDLVKRAAMLFPDKDIIGWDIAYTPNGPVVIEANANPHSEMTQIALKGLKNSRVYQGVIESISKKPINR